jgi:hypothetical protein
MEKYIAANMNKMANKLSNTVMAQGQLHQHAESVVVADSGFD